MKGKNVIALDDYQALIRKVERLRRTYDQAIGAKKELILRLKTDFGVSSLRKAIRKFERMKKQELQAFRIYSKAKLRFESKWAKQLKGI